MSTDLQEATTDDTTVASDDVIPSRDDGMGTDESSGSPEEQSWVTPELLERGQSYGLDANSIEAYGSIENFDRSMIFADTQTVKSVQQQSGDDLPSQTQAAPTATAQQQKEPPQGAFQYGEQLDELINDSDIDPAIVEFVKAVKAQNDHVAQQLAQFGEMAPQFAAMQQQFQQQEDRQYVEFFDTNIASLGKDYAELLGTGSGNDLAEGPQMQARQKLSETFDALTFASEQSGRRVGAKALFQRAVAATFTDFAQRKTEQNANQQTTDRIRDQKGRFTAEPTSRDTSSGLSPDQTTRAAFDAVADRIGLPR